MKQINAIGWNEWIIIHLRLLSRRDVLPSQEKFTCNAMNSVSLPFNIHSLTWHDILRWRPVHTFTPPIIFSFCAPTHMGRRTVCVRVCQCECKYYQISMIFFLDYFSWLITVRRKIGNFTWNSSVRGLEYFHAMENVASADDELSSEPIELKSKSQTNGKRNLGKFRDFTDEHSIYRSQDWQFINSIWSLGCLIGNFDIWMGRMMLETEYRWRCARHSISNGICYQFPNGQ